MKRWIMASMAGCIALLMVSCSDDNRIKAFAEEFEAKYSKRSANYDADRMNLGLENIPADIRFNFVKK